MRLLALLITALLFAVPVARAQTVIVVGDSLGTITIDETLGVQDTLTVLVDTTGALGGYMVHRPDSVHYRIPPDTLDLSRSLLDLIMSDTPEWVRVWEAMRRLGEQ